MRTALLLLLCILAVAVPASAATVSEVSPQDAEHALVAVFVFGDAFGWMGCGFVVGDGGWVVTTADLVTESFGSDTKATAKRVTVLSGWTGDAYDAEVKAVDPKSNLALIKLPIKGLPSMPLAGPDGLKTARAANLGQILSGDQVGAKWSTTLYALGREADPKKKTAKLAVRKWQAAGAAIVETRSVNWLFLSKMDPEDSPPRAALVWRENGGAVALYNGRLVVEGGRKPATYGQCLTSTEITKFLKKSGLDAETLQKPAKPTVKPDKVSEQALQSIWAALSSVILGKWTEAQQNAKILVDFRKESALTHLLMGVALAGGGKTEEGIKSFDKAISLDKAAPSAYYSRGVALAFLKKSKEAEADFRKAAEQDATDARPLMALAELLSTDKARLNEAEQFARKAVSVDPQRPRPRLTLGLVLKSKRSYDEAITELKTALKIAPAWGMAKAALAATYEAAGNAAEAETAYRDLVKAEPKNPDALFALASFLADHDKKDEAKKLVADLLTMKPPAELEDAAKELEKKL